MDRFNKSVLVAVTAMGMGCASFMVQAEDHPAPGQKTDGGHQWNHERPSPERMKERIAKHQAALHDKLKLNAGQEGAWNTYVAATTPTDMGKHPDRAEWAKLSAPDRGDRMLARMKERDARMADHVAAMKTFYAVLTPEQKKVFDANSMHGGHHHGERGEHAGIK